MADIQINLYICGMQSTKITQPSLHISIKVPRKVWIAVSKHVNIAVTRITFIQGLLDPLQENSFIDISSHERL